MIRAGSLRARRHWTRVAAAASAVPPQRKDGVLDAHLAALDAVARRFLIHIWRIQKLSTLCKLT